MSPNRMAVLRRGLLILAGLCAAWAALLIVSGGLAVRVGGLALSSRNPRNPVILALLAAAAAWAVPASGGRWRAMCAEWGGWRDRIASIGRRWPRAVDAAALIAFAGIVLQIAVWAGARPLWLDEEMIALNVRDRSWAELAGPLWLTQSAPFGWLILQRAMLVTWGPGELAVRFVPLLFGVATLVAAVWAGRRWLGAVGAAAFLMLCTFGRWLSHYPFELKQYSADAFFGLLLPMLAVWAIEAQEPRAWRRRATAWWAGAAVAQWFANGAALATPACAAVLLIAAWRRAGWRGVVAVALPGLLWVASFGVHVLVSMRHALGSKSLRAYWADGLPPDRAGVVETLGWVFARLPDLAANPGGTGHWTALWLLAALGLVLSRRSVGAVFAAVVASAFVLGAFSMVPLHDRLALWIVPALYLGVAVAVERGVRGIRDARMSRTPVRLIVTAIAVFAGLGLCADIVDRGLVEVRRGRGPGSNHGLDDRAAVQWLMQQQQPGDALVSTHFGLPALWWYGPVSVSDTAGAGSRTPVGGAIFEAGHRDASAECSDAHLREVLRDQRRLLVYTGFPDMPAGYDDLLFESLGRIGSVSAYRRFADLSRAAVIDLRVVQRGGEAIVIPPAGAPAQRERLDGCVHLQLARRW